MFNLFKKEAKSENNNISVILLASLLIHAARIDENYSEKEKKIIIEFTSMLTNSLKESDESIKNLSQEDTVNLVKKAEEFENNSNQILEYTREVKKMDSDTKYLVLEFLWKIILSDDKSDVYESTLMRRICGLLYVPDKLSGEIKSNILKGKNI